MIDTAKTRGDAGQVARRAVRAPGEMADPVREGGSVREGGRESTREQILEASRRALARDGYERITTRRIAQEAGVNIATLHYYFGTKEALLSETIRFVLARIDSVLRAATADSATPTDALRAAVDAVWESVREQPGILRYDLVVRGFRDPSARTAAQEVYQAFRAFTSELIERHVQMGGQLTADVTPEILAHYLVSALDGAILQYIVNGDVAATTATLKLALGHVLALLGEEAQS